MNIQLVSNMLQKIGSTISAMQIRLQALEDNSTNKFKSQIDEDLSLVYNGQKDKEDVKEQVDEINQRLEYLETELREMKNVQKQNQKQIDQQKKQIDEHHKQIDKQQKYIDEKQNNEQLQVPKTKKKTST